MSSIFGSWVTATSAVKASSGQSFSASDGHSAIRLTSAKRSGVAKAVRGSMIVRSKPASLAITASDWLICTAPITTMRGGGTWTLMKRLRPSASTAADLPERKAAHRASPSAPSTVSRSVNSRSVPSARSETRAMARRSARAALRIFRWSRRINPAFRQTRGCDRRRTGRRARRSRRRRRIRGCAGCRCR